MLTLKYPYISVTDGSRRSYGGDQGKSENATMRSCGCGVIAAADVLLYLSRLYDCVRDAGLDPTGAISSEEYEKLTGLLRRRYFPLIPHAGINGSHAYDRDESVFYAKQAPVIRRMAFL